MSILQKSIFSLFKVLFLMTPLLVTPWTKELFEFPKMLWVYLITIWIVGLFIIGKIKDSPRKRTVLNFKNPLAIPALGFLFIYTLATVFSIHPYTSLFGYYGRFNGGLLSLLCYVALFFIFIAEYKNSPQELNRTINWLLFSGLVVSIWGILQHMGVDKNYWIQDSQARVFSTLGQPNWLASYLLLIIPVALWKLFLAKAENKKWWVGVVISCLVTLWFTYSLSGLLGLAVTVSLIPVFTSQKILKAHLKELAVIGGISLLVFISQPGIFRQRIHDLVRPAFGIRSIHRIRPTYAALEAPQRGDTSSIRLIVWKGTLDLIKSNWLLGTGPETFAYTFLKYRPTELNQTSEWDFLYNKAHNEYLNLAAGAGILGLSTYLLVIGKFILFCWRHRCRDVALPTKGGCRTTCNVSTLLVTGWLGALVSIFFGFSVVPVSLLLWMIPAVVITRQQMTADPGSAGGRSGIC